ncbi:hypothetical protein FDF29_11860 [Clostridium botulinum]|uniref:Phage protein n=3 Tax=Clostridium botulinum TaxID=1491 RepID=A5I2G5_CLOBH|nr:hypothetical protein [Clostridium botulinum]ACQ54028.1 conserved domain protein [Clostridium botulinum Ba4 str. 657]AXG91115.1 hypothetical protein AGE29_04775 [Clostridium botulinum]NEZ93646.1 hypothetical protein [Clostridium botulinum]NFL68372.1 hypothetical protein [Clostridium botulinum]NFQ52551.1 hypothetical protein [Clostridium botulinum]
MLNKEQIEQCRRIVKCNGVTLQKFVAIEELAELQQAISKYQREPTIFGIDNIEEEIADVHIVLEELKIIFGIDKEEIENRIDYKLDRELKRIKCRELSKQ